MTGVQADDGAILCEIEGSVAVVTLDRPRARNAMNTNMWESLRRTFADIGRDESVRAVILRGSGGTFSAGHDIKEMDQRSIEEIERSFAVIERTMETVEACPVPVIGVLRGVAAGGGCELLLSCDVRVAARSARIGMPVARLGITISRHFAERLQHIVGASRAKDLLFTARLVRGSEALRMGLVNHAGPDALVEERARRIAERVAQLSPTSIRHSKQMLSRVGRAEHRFTGNPVEFREGVRAWVEKREPQF